MNQPGSVHTPMSPLEKEHGMHSVTRLILPVVCAMSLATPALTAAQPANNIVRGALQAMAMAMAGVQGLEISTFDEPFRTRAAIWAGSKAPTVTASSSRRRRAPAARPGAPTSARRGPIRSTRATASARVRG